MGKEEFLEYLKESSQRFDEWIKDSEKVKVISHIDADGISSATEFLLYLYENEKYSNITFVRNLDKDLIKNVLSEEYDIFVFLDLGSSLINEIKSFAKNKKVLFIDHHKIRSRIKIERNFININPNIFGVDGSKEIANSGITYLFLKNISVFIRKYSYLSLIGAIGDMQEGKDGFVGINKDILQELIENNIIEVRKGLRIPGIFSRPLHKVLEYSTELYIPGVTGSEEGAIKLLQEAGIPLKRGGDWIKYKDLSEEEVKKLITLIILRRIKGNVEDAENVLSNLYIIKNEDVFFNELSEISYTLNACGRLGKYSIGVGVLLGDERARDMALDFQIKYKKEILDAIKLFKEKSIEIIDKENYTIINYKDKLREDLVSPIASILFTSELKDKKLVLVAAKKEDEKLKISIRCKNFDISKIVEEASEKVGGVGGGHDVAAGAVIPENKLKEFIRNLLIGLRKENIYL